MTLQQLKEAYSQKSAEMRALNESTPDDGWTSEVRSKWEGMKTDLKALREKIEREEELRAQDQAFVEGLDRDPQNKNKPKDGPEAEQRSAWDNWVRGGMEGLSAEQRSMVLEMRAQGTNPNEAGGFTVPTTLQARVIESLVTYGGIASVCQLLQTDNGAPIAWATSDGGEEEGELIGENKAAKEKDVEFGMGTLGSHTISSKIIRVSEQLLQDAGIDMEAFLAGRISKRVARTRNRLIVQGTGAGETADAPAQPKGLEVSTAQGAMTANATKFTWQEVNSLIHSIDPAYRTSAKFRLAFNDKTLQLMEEMVDANGRPLWLPSIDSDRPATILKHQYVIDQAIADIGAGKKFMYGGDFNELVLRAVRSLTLKRLVERYAEYGQVGFLAFVRFGLVLQDTAAIKHLVGKTA
ncbi:phage major capsid protein [Pseudomonas kurunegalensis]|uniref:phage major capsid protein n=1 Tax=Pseudomonas kurunegalensis TaxID=485880 RepID=UPI002895D4D1|nr:phage major capsid protein [Pseudomonas kurunegalensis]MDT3750491.1 phage major capsid protein [Pseudomonas kurunegalensis]